jgi:ABC-2 type transport system ATP-binding protein
MAILKVTNLKKHFGSVKAVDGISFEIEKGEIFGFLGPNGAGKTTTIRMILDFIRANSGETEIFDIKSDDQNFHETRNRIGYLIPGTNLVESWTGKDHIDFQSKLHDGKFKADDLIKKFSFDPKPKVKNLSTGNRQKLGLILALMNSPELLIMDEPTAGLDPILQEEFYKTITQLSEQGTTVFMSSHNLPEVEKICSRVAMIKSGKLIAVKKISELEGKKIHSVRVTFAEPVKKDDLIGRNVAITDEMPNGFELSVKSGIDQFIKKIAKYKVESVSITQASLEEIFMEFYK